MCALFLYADIYVIVRIVSVGYHFGCEVMFDLWIRSWNWAAFFRCGNIYVIFVLWPIHVPYSITICLATLSDANTMHWNEISTECARMTLISTDSRINANIYPELIKLITIAYKFGPQIPKCWAIYEERWFCWRILLVFPIFTYESWLFI